MSVSDLTADPESVAEQEPDRASWVKVSGVRHGPFLPTTISVVPYRDAITEAAHDQPDTKTGTGHDQPDEQTGAGHDQPDPDEQTGAGHDQPDPDEQTGAGHDQPDPDEQTGAGHDQPNEQTGAGLDNPVGITGHGHHLPEVNTVTQLEYPDGNTGAEQEDVASVLPENSVIVSSDANWTVIRSPIKDESDWNHWLATFKLNTNTSWISRSRQVPSNHFSFSKDYVCHHSSHGKVQFSRKTCNCGARIKVRIKRFNKFTKCRDPHIKAGRLAIIRLNNKHSHETSSLEALSYLPPSSMVRTRFTSYFDTGLGPADASKQHALYIRTSAANYKAALANASINPKMRTINWWFEVWKKTQAIPAQLVTEEIINESESEVLNSTSEVIVNNDNEEEPSGHSLLPEVEISSSSDTVVSFSALQAKLTALDQHFSTDREELRKLIERVENIGTKSEWDDFISHGFNSITISSAQEVVEITVINNTTPDASKSNPTVFKGIIASSRNDEAYEETVSIQPRNKRLRKNPKFKNTSFLFKKH